MDMTMGTGPGPEEAGLVLPSSDGAVEFDTVVPPSGQIAVLAPVQCAVGGSPLGHTRIRVSSRVRPSHR